MRVTIQDIIKMMESSINDDRIIVENYTKVVGIIDKINKEQAESIFQNLVYNHEVSSQEARSFQAKSNLFTKQAQKGGLNVNPMDASKLEGLHNQSEEISTRRSELEIQIGKAFLDKGFIDQKTYDKYYPE